METKLPSSSEELTEAAIKGAVSAIPVVGGLIAELGSCLVSPMNKRRQAWCEEVEAALQELSEKHRLLPDALAENPLFLNSFSTSQNCFLPTAVDEEGM